jgi:predicted pyridoxine 5'-phosphate oxidase superfamily flavin-nucleotide-binding protein
MSPQGVALDSILPAFEGVLPATVATCSADGMPNISFLSIVRRVDAERIALTNQFFSKTTQNLNANESVTVRVVHPGDMAQYDLYGRYLHSETSGQLFDSMRVQLDAVAAQTGMVGTFRLRAIDIVTVEECMKVGEAGLADDAARPEGGVSALGVLIRRVADCRDLAEATRVALEALADLFGFEHSILLIADEGSARLFAVAAHGYSSGRVGAEVGYGEGLIGVAAERRQSVRIASMARSRSLAGAASASDEAEMNTIPMRGLDDAQSVVAAPLILQDRLIGILYLDSARSGHFGAKEAGLIEVIAGHLAVTIALLEGGGADPARPVRAAAVPAQQVTAPHVLAFHERDGSLFIDGDYIIRGVAGRILFRLVSEHLSTGRTQFLNKELRLDPAIDLPAGNDNLEARLVALRRRLAERSDIIALNRVGRGRIELAVRGLFEVKRHEGSSA